MIFEDLFKQYGFEVKRLSEYSYIAKNDVFCVPFTEFLSTPYNRGTVSYKLAGVSLPVAAEEAILTKYGKDKSIGFRVFSDYMSNRLQITHIGNICNHDHTVEEVEDWLRAIKESL